MTSKYSAGVDNKMLFVTGLLDTRSTDDEGVGQIRGDELGNRYRWIKNVDTTAFVAKQPVVYDSAANAGTRAWIEDVTAPVTADLPNAAGVTMTGIGISGALMYGWIQVYGVCPDVRITTPATGGADIEEGSQLVPVNAQTYLAYQGDADTAMTLSNHFVALEVVATATGAAVVTKNVMIKCL